MTKSTSSAATSAPVTDLPHTVGTLPSESGETNIELLIALLADEQRIQAESKARETDYKAKLDALHTAGFITDKLSSNGYTLSRQSRTSWQYPSTVTRQIKALQELAQLNGDAEPSVTSFWTLRTIKST